MEQLHTIQPAVPSEAEEIVAMHRELAEYCGYDMRNFNITPQGVTEIISSSNQSHYSIARSERGISGMMLCHRIPMGWTGVPGVYVEDLYVRPEARGHGVGRYLMRAACVLALDYADGNSDAAYIRLDTATADNEDTIGFYRRLGMQEDNMNFRLYGQGLSSMAGAL